MVNILPPISVAPALPSAPPAMRKTAEFAVSRMADIGNALGSIFVPAAVLGLTWVGFKMTD